MKRWYLDGQWPQHSYFSGFLPFLHRFAQDLAMGSIENHHQYLLNDHTNKCSTEHPKKHQGTVNHRYWRHEKDHLSLARIHIAEGGEFEISEQKHLRPPRSWLCVAAETLQGNCGTSVMAKMHWDSQVSGRMLQKSDRKANDVFTTWACIVWAYRYKYLVTDCGKPVALTSKDSKLLLSPRFRAEVWALSARIHFWQVSAGSQNYLSHLQIHWLKSEKHSSGSSSVPDPLKG